ncbi:SDR family oxidoreductase [Williamsia serinedens]|uniref:SDR family oxidoreductase n=1 Tax=Williamsia serinedens TaxID=391736 RepID=UPI0020A27B03|nr:SDR family oxidoreductase [Williamsia serinedens]
MRTAVVTGASSGIGRATAAALTAADFRVIGTSRDSRSVADPLPGVEYRDLDLASSESIRSFAAAVSDLEVDVLVNNAGESQCGPLEELPADALERLFRLNVLGHIELTQLLLPSMRARGEGRVVFVGSMLASFPLAFRSSYVASKAALKGFATAARLELAPFGVHLTTVEPGSIDTGLSDRRTKYIADDSPYRRAFTTTVAALDTKESQGISADRVAQTILRAATARRPEPLYAVGSRAPLVFAARRLLPRRVIESVMARSYGLS